MAQIAAGWRIVIDSKVLLGEPTEGVVEINAIDGSASINGKPAEFAMARELQRWASDELRRKDLGSSWLTRTTVDIRYKRSNRLGREPRVELKAVARISSAFGDVSDRLPMTSRFTSLKVRSRLLSRFPVHRFPDKVGVPVVPPVLLNHVDQDPSQARCLTVRPWAPGQSLQSAIGQGLGDH